MDGVPRHAAWMAVAVAVAATFLGGCTDTTTSTQQGAVSGASGVPVGKVDDQTRPPWPLPADVSARVAAAGLDLGPMGTAEHYHPHLRIVIDGQDVPVPGGIGVDPGTGAMSALHTHEPDGTLHIEADTVGETFTLGQLFTQWGVKLSTGQIGGVRAKDGQQVTVQSNGRPVGGDPSKLRLEPDQQIVLRLS